MKITLRDATTEDASSLLTLFEQLEYPTSTELLQNRLKNFLAHEGYGIVLAICNDSIAGLIGWSKSMLLVSDHNRFHIEALIVEQNYRGQNIGRRLIKYVEELAATHKPTIVDLVSGVRRATTGAHQFYEKLGYEVNGPMSKLYFRKTL